MAVPAYLTSLLVSQYRSGPEAFATRNAHPWLVWGADTWTPSSVDGNTRVLKATTAPERSTKASDALCFSLAPRRGSSVLLLGRSSSADVVVNDGTVSRRHAALTAHADGRWTVSSVTAGAVTMLDDRALFSGQEAELHDGSRLEIGNVTLWFYRPWTFIGRMRDLSASAA